MIGRKGVSPFIAFVLVTAISIAGIVIVMRGWDTSLEKTENYAIVSEAKGVLNSINSAIKEVSAEGEGSARKLSLSISGGQYRVSSAQDSIVFVLDNREEIFSPGLSKKEGDMYVEAYQNYTISLKLNYTSIDIATDNRWSSGSYHILVKNNDTSSGKAVIVFDLL